TSMPAPGLPGSSDKSAGARAEIDAFAGLVRPSHIVAMGAGAGCSLPGDWGYRRLVLHYARLAQIAGGVDAFLLGSGLRGLTAVRDEASAFPFVEVLCELAEDVRAILPQAKLTYGADWSEYFGHQPADGSGDVL